MLDFLKNSQIFQKFENFNEKMQNNAKISTGAVQRCDNLVDFEKKILMLKNAPTLAIRSVDTEENEPRQVQREMGIREIEISFAISPVLAFEL